MDTTFVYILNPEKKDETLEIFFKSIPFIILVLGIILNHIYNKYKTRSELKETRCQLKYSLNKLVNVTQQQAEYIAEFKAQFETENMDFKPIGLDTGLNTKNIMSISSADQYKFFITKAKGDIQDKSEIYDKFNYIVTIIDKCEKHLEEDMNKYIRRINELGGQVNSHNQLLRTLMNEWIGKKINGTATEAEIEFINYMQSEQRKLQANGEINNLFYAMKNFHEPLLRKAVELEIEQFVNILPLGIALLSQLKFTRKNYFENYKHLEDGLGTSHEYLKIILASKTFN